MLEEYDENLKLARLWDAQNLLCLSDEPAYNNAFSRVFNNLKSAVADRQIGDRRWMNAEERSIRGPSRNLPGGYLMTSLHCPRGFVLKGIVTDRKDFYHQAATSRSRAKTNMLPFAFSSDLFKGSSAWKDLLEEIAGRRGGREKVGDRYASHQRNVLVAEPEEVYVGFSSLFQGDHLGVEFALSSHTSLLQKKGLLKPQTQILGHHPFPLGPLWEGLVIDDYFAIGLQRINEKASPVVMDCFKSAKQAYSEEEVLGSDAKDVVNSDHFKVIGAEVDCSERTRSRGLVVVAAPVKKRLSLVAVTMRAAALRFISRGLVSQLSGCWNSILMYRRCLVVSLNEIYKLGVINGESEDDIVEMSRSVAGELVMASVMSFLAATDISLPYCSKAFATDASMKKGAIVSREIDPSLAEVIWLGGDKKGSYTRLENPFAAALRGLEIENDLFEEEFNEAESNAKSYIPASFDFSFDFCEICGGSGVVSVAAAKMGMTVMPPIELSDSPHFDLQNPRLIEWLCFMLERGKLRSMMLEPPCTSFSPAAHPAVRSYRKPKGFRRRCPKTWLGNLLAFRCFTLAWVAYHFGRPNLFEQPFLSKMAWLSIWAFLRSIGFNETSIASRAFGSVHLKKFRLLSYGLDTSLLSAQCSGDHKHIRIEGALTKASAVYVPRLAQRFAEVFYKAVCAAKDEAASVSKKAAIESAVLNDILMTGSWKIEASWIWRGPSHINILESQAYLTLLRKLCLEGESFRFTALLDSRVAKCAHAKGRSSSLAMTPTLKKAAALLVSGGLYGSYGFAPTRLNTADDPTRDKEVRPSSRNSCLHLLSTTALQYLHSLQLPRPLAGWIRFTLLFGILPVSLRAEEEGCKEEEASLSLWNFVLSHQLLGLTLLGLSLICSLLLTWCSWTAPPKPRKTPKTRSIRGKQWNHYSRCPPLVFLLLDVVSAMDGLDVSAADRLRAERRVGTQLFTDRVMKPQTRKRRDNLLALFEKWCLNSGEVSIMTILGKDGVDSEVVSQLLVKYGRALYYAGKPYGTFSETINAVASQRGSLRRQLGPAWDLAFCWVSDEPASHHPAMPRAVLLAISALGMLWAWPVESGIFLLAWTGLLRIGEVLGAYRRDLFLPRDSAPGSRGALLRINVPKTRGRAARHQSARIDQVDVVEYLEAVFGDYPPDRPIWSMSSTTLRKRLNMIQTALGLPTSKSHDSCPYDLGSFRPGGATDMIYRFEDSELVRRRGRWVSVKVLEIYLQEVSTATFHTRMSDEAKDKVQRLSDAFDDIRLQTQNFLHAKVPPIAWRHLWSTQT